MIAQSLSDKHDCVKQELLRRRILRPFAKTVGASLSNLEGGRLEQIF